MKISVGSIVGLGGGSDFYKVMRDWESHPSIWQRIRNFIKYRTFNNDIVVVKLEKSNRIRDRDLIAESVVTNLKNFIS